LKRLYKGFIALKQIPRVKAHREYPYSKTCNHYKFPHERVTAYESLEGKGNMERIRDHRLKRDAQGENVCRKL
jgi:hypothetical protein